MKGHPIMKKYISLILAVILVLTLFGCSKPEEETTTATTTTTTTETTTSRFVTDGNPLTGQKKFAKSAKGKRPVAIVVENAEPARPQWGIETPDIIVEGEVEGGISRMLWIYADYKSVPEKVGPLRSARPSYVRFSTLFDAIFIHWGGSHSKAGYEGGYSTIKRLKVDDIDGINGGSLFGRDQTRGTSLEHRGILYGNNISDTIKNKGFRVKQKKDKTSFTFNVKNKKVGKDAANNVGVTFSSRTNTRTFTYNSKDLKYHTNDWQTDVKFKNLIVLQDSSTYITTPYKGGSTTYLNYDYKGGEGYLISMGSYTKIKWDVAGDKLNIRSADGKDIAFNIGKSYIAFSSTNNGGNVAIS